uniref:class E basic helix-loop-helix protein 41-like n=1 Tax=Myxine glutinosa TaxID=7769 RepID=UPI00358FA85F
MEPIIVPDDEEYEDQQLIGEDDIDSRDSGSPNTGLPCITSCVSCTQPRNQRDGKKNDIRTLHRLIEKRRRDRINDYILQFKQLLPDHVKKTNCGHMDKAVVLERTLTHMRAITKLSEQQQSQIQSLQMEKHSAESTSTQHRAQSAVATFCAGFRACAAEALHYLVMHEAWSERDAHYTHLASHLECAASSGLPNGPCVQQKNAHDKKPVVFHGWVGSGRLKRVPDTQTDGMKNRGKHTSPSCKNIKLECAALDETPINAHTLP